MTGVPHPQVEIRPARPEDAPALGAPALRAKAHWGYDAATLAAYRDALTITPADIAAHTVRVASRNGDACGFYRLRVAGERAEPTDLWTHAAAAAGAGGCRTLLIQSDPHAAGFYRAMGATPIGTKTSTVIPGRELPLSRPTLP